MAKRIVDEEMRFSIIVNGNQAQKELFDLEQSTRKLSQSNKDLRAEQAKLVRQGKKGSEEYKRLSAEIRTNNKVIKENKLRMESLQKQIGITGLTMGQLTKRATLLKLKLRNVIPGGAAEKKYRAELAAIKARLKQIGVTAAKTKLTLSNIADGFNRYQALGASIILTGTGIILSLQKMIDYNGKLADAQSDVQKTTGKTKEEVDELTKSFGLLKTRTQRIDLLKIAEEGGRIGIVKDEILDFVKVMNKANVALGDTFSGGVEQVASQLGKIKFLFKETKDLGVDVAFNAIGSSLNELGADGNSTEQNIAEFTLRIGALPDALKPSISETLALGAAFEESGIQAEISSRGYSIFLQKAANNTAKFAEVMGVPKKEVEDLINTNPLEFFLQFSRGLKGLDATQVAETLKYLGVNAIGSTKAVGAAANNQERFRELLELSNTALLEGASLTTEYDIKNNNLAATLKKVQRRILAAFTSEKVVKGLSDFVEWLAKFIGATDDADGKVTRFRNRLIAFLKTVIILTAAVLSYNTAVKLTALWTGTLDHASRLYIITQKIQVALTKTLRTGTLLLKAAFALATLNITRARAAMVLLNRTMLLSPIGLIVGLITAAAGAYLLFSENSKKAVTSQSLFNDAQKEAIKSTAEEVKQKQLWLQVAQSETATRQQKQEAVDNLNRTVPEYNNNLTIETANTILAKDALNKHIEALKRSAVAHVLEEKIKKKAVELAEKEGSSLEDNIKWYEQLWDSIKAGGNVYGAAANSMKTSVKNKLESIEATKEEIKVLEELYRKQLQKNGAAGTPSGPKEGDVKTIDGKTFVYKNGKWVIKKVFSPGDTGSKAAAPKANNNDVLRAQQAAENARISLIKDSFDKEMAQNEANHKFKLLRLQEQLVKESELKKIQASIDAARIKGDDKTVAVLEEVRSKWIDKNAAINSQIESENQLHELRKGAIIEKGYANDIKESEENYKREKVIRQRKFLEDLNSVSTLAAAKEKLKNVLSDRELAQIITLKDAKAALQDQFNQSELEKEKAHLDELLKELNRIMSSSEFEGFELSLLTPEQKETFIAEIEALKLKIEELTNAKNKLTGKSDEGGVDFASEIDVLGFSIEQWETTFENLDTVEQKIAAAQMAVGGFLNAWSSYHQFVSANQQKELQRFERATERKKQKQKQLLDSGFINQRQYDAAVKALDEQRDKKKAEMEFKAARREKHMNIASAVANTAIGVSKALAQGGFVLGVPWAAIVGALGAIQIGIASAMPLPAKGFEKGYYNIQREQDGKVFNAEFGGESRTGLVNKPTVFLAGEGGKNFPEMIIDGQSLKQMDPGVKQSLYGEIARMKGFERGHYQNQTPTPQFSENTSIASSDNALNITLTRTNELLDNLDKNGITAFMSKDIKNIKLLKDELKRLEKREEKNKR